VEELQDNKKKLLDGEPLGVPARSPFEVA
jgi:hypothetical protein